MARTFHSGENDLLPEPGSTGSSLWVIRDRFGRLWLGDRNVDVNGDLAAQGCWRCRETTLASIVDNHGHRPEEDD